jgi:hypothetical protein
LEVGGYNVAPAKEHDRFWNVFVWSAILTNLWLVFLAFLPLAGTAYGGWLLLIPLISHALCTIVCLCAPWWVDRESFFDGIKLSLLSLFIAPFVFSLSLGPGAFLGDILVRHHHSSTSQDYDDGYDDGGCGVAGMKC